jgi:hypothetical protein
MRRKNNVGKKNTYKLNQKWPTGIAWQAGLSLQGRVMLANSIIYFKPRYWMQSSIPPDKIIDGLEADV